MADEIIKKYELLPHLEGGYFKRTYQSNSTIETSGGSRYLSTAILFLLKTEDVSRFHRIQSDEMWHFYEGDSILIIEIMENGSLKRTVLGKEKNLEKQYVVKVFFTFKI